MRVVVDYEYCEGNGRCEEAAPEVFELAADADQVTVIDEHPPEQLRDKVEVAVLRCPRAAIRIEE